MPKRRIKLLPDAAAQFKALSAAERSRLKIAMQASLAEDDATLPNKNRFALRGISNHSEFEFRNGDLRAFYRVVEDEVLIDAIGKKINNQLSIGGKRITL